MTNVMQLVKTPLILTENKLIRMKQLQTEIKVRQAEMDMLKEEVINEHLLLNGSYKTAKGLELATYSGYEQMQFQQSKFRIDHEDIYKLYSENKMIFKFLLK